MPEYENKQCVQCNEYKRISIHRIRCSECLRQNKEERWQQEKQRICENPDNRPYMIELPIEGSLSTICVNVYPNVNYGDNSGQDLMRQYLSRRWKKGKIPIDSNVRDFRYRHKPRWYGDISIHDIEKLTKKGNVLNDTTFDKHKKKLEELTDKEERKKFISSNKPLKLSDFHGHQEATSIRYQNLNKRRERELEKQEEEEEGEWNLEDIDS
jgi:hypothetical protein